MVSTTEQRDEQIKRQVTYGIFIFIGVIILLVILFGTFYIVRAGERGVLLTFGNPSPVAISKWDGKMPFVTGGGSLPFISIPAGVNSS